MLCLYSYGEDHTNYRSVRQKLHDDLRNEIAMFNELFSQRLISEDILNVLLTDRKIYYYTAQSVLASRNHLEMKSNKEDVPEDVYTLWQEAVHAVPLESELILRSYYSFDYLLMYLWYQIYTSFDFDEFVALRAEKRANGMVHAHNIALAKEYLSGDVLEFYMASTFYDQHRKRQYDNHLIQVFEEFKSDFPHSHYIPFVEETLEKMLEKQKEM